METIKQALDVLLRDLKERKEKAAEISPELLAKKIFSRKEAPHAQAGVIKNGVLYLRADSSTWLYYFNLHKKELLGKFSRQNSQIKDLKFGLGELAGKKQRG